MDKEKEYNDIVEYYKNKNVNKKENITVEPSVNISYKEKVINNEKTLKEEDTENKRIKENPVKNNEKNESNLKDNKLDKSEKESPKKEIYNYETEKDSSKKEDTKKKKVKKHKKVKNSKEESGNKELNNEEDETIERKKKISIKKLALNIFTICIIGIVCGYFLGNAIISKVYMNVNYDKFNEINLRNTDEEIDSWENKKFSELTPTQIFIIAERRLKTYKYYSISGTSVIKNSFKNQDVKIKFYKNDNEFYSGNRTTGFVNSVTNYFYSGGNVRSYKGTPKSDGSSDWKSKKVYTVDEFKEVYGNDADTFLYYIVSTQTVVEEQYIGRVSKAYKYKIKLTDDSSIINYVKQMSYISGIDSPVFNCVEFEFTVDENFKLLTVVTHDIYVVNYVALVTCEGSSNLTFTYDKIPELETEPEVE